VRADRQALLGIAIDLGWADGIRTRRTLKPKDFSSYRFHLRSLGAGLEAERELNRKWIAVYELNRRATSSPLRRREP